MWLLSLTKLSLLIVPGVALWVSALLMSSSMNADRSRSGAYVILRSMANLMMLLGSLGIVVSLLNPVGLLLLPVLTLCLLSILTFNIRSSREEFSRCLMQAAEHQLPLAVVARTFANHASWLVRSRFDRFATRLESSVPIGDVLAEVPLNIPATMQIQLAMQDEHSDGTEGIRLVVDMEEAHRKAVREWVESCLYLFGLALFILLGTLYFVWRSIPAFAGIVRQLEKKNASGELDWVALSQMELIVYLVPLIVVAILLTLLTAAYYLEILPQSWSFLYVGNRRFERAGNLMVLGLAAQSGKTLSDGLQGLSKWHPRRKTRRQALHGLALERLGTSEAELLQKLGWIGRDSVGSVDRASRRGTLGEHLMRIALENAERSRRGWVWMSRLLAPLGLIVLGGFVFCLALAVFLYIRDTALQEA